MRQVEADRGGGSSRASSGLRLVALPRGDRVSDPLAWRRGDEGEAGSEAEAESRSHTHSLLRAYGSCCIGAMEGLRVTVARRTSFELGRERAC